MPSLLEVRRFRQRLLRWYGRRGRRFPWRRDATSLYRLIVTEVLLQRTRVETVADIYASFFRRFPSWARLAKASQSELRSYLKPIGLWKRRAAALSRLARVMHAAHGRFPRLRSDLEQLPGVGQYVANAISLFAHGDAAPLLDSGMARVLERHFGPRRLVDIRYDPYLQRLSHLVVASPHSRVLNWALLDLAAMVCRQKLPSCHECPIRATCHFHREGRSTDAADHAKLSSIRPDAALTRQSLSHRSIERQHVACGIQSSTMRERKYCGCKASFKA